jgi:hypothetical protein
MENTIFHTLKNAFDLLTLTEEDGQSRTYQVQERLINVFGGAYRAA